MWPISSRGGGVDEPPGALKITQEHAFGSGYTDSDLIESARVEGAARLYTKGWGENRAPHLMREVQAARNVHESLLGHEMDRERLEIEAELERARPEILRQEHGVIMALDELEHAERRREELRRTLAEKKLSTPDVGKWLHALRTTFIVLLALGELFILGPAFQVLGLKDSPFVFFLPFTPQHLGALSSVTALFILAHSLAEHEPEGVAGPTRRPETFRSAVLDATAGRRVLLGGVACLLLGLAAVREIYLAQTGHSDLVMGLGFLALNLGLVIAACLVSRPDSRPYAAQWQNAVQAAAAALRTYTAAARQYEQEVGEYNATVASHDILLSQYSNAFDAAHHDAERQIQLIAGQTRLAQPELVVEQMFEIPGSPDGPRSIRNHVRSYLSDEDAAGIPIHRYHRLDMKRVSERRTHRELRAIDGWASQPPAGVEQSPVENQQQQVDDRQRLTPDTLLPVDERQPAAPVLDLQRVELNGSSSGPHPTGPHPTGTPAP